MPAPAFLHRRERLPWGALAGAAALGLAAWANHALARRAEAANPPRGRFVAAGGRRLHYTEHGDPARPPLVLLHGCGAMALEIETSGLVELAARDFRVIVVDRPGYGHSPDERGQGHAPQAQADLIAAAIRALGLRKPVVLGHSWGAMVALALGLRHPDVVRALVLASGYHTPSFRFDTFLVGAPAVPVLGPLLAHTVSPLLGRLLWPLMVRRVFAPRPVSRRFADDYPVGLALRPRSLQVAAREQAMLAVQATALAREAPRLEVPTVIVAGEKDRLLMTSWHSRRLHQRVPHSKLRIVAGAGHMVHHTHPEAVAAAIKEAFELSAKQIRPVVVPPRVGAAAQVRHDVLPDEIHDPVVEGG